MAWCQSNDEGRKEKEIIIWTSSMHAKCVIENVTKNHSAPMATGRAFFSRRKNIVGVSRWKNISLTPVLLSSLNWCHFPFTQLQAYESLVELLPWQTICQPKEITSFHILTRGRKMTENTIEPWTTIQREKENQMFIFVIILAVACGDKSNRVYCISG